MSGMRNEIRQVLEALGALDHAADVEAELIGRIARDVGDHVHDIVKGAAMTMPTARAAIGLGMHVAAQILVETLSFANKSVDGGDDGRNLALQARQLFDDLVDTNIDIPGLRKH